MSIGIFVNKEFNYIGVAGLGSLMGLRDDRARERIKKWYDASGITQKQFGAKIGWTQPSVYGYFKGHQNTDLDTLALMARTFGHTLAELFADEEPEDTEESALVAAFNSLPTEAAKAAVRQQIESYQRLARTRREGSPKPPTLMRGAMLEKKRGASNR
jgi:transcriptional regulator with XRE-family HTH domain